MANSPKKGPDYYEGLKEKFQPFIVGTELLAVTLVTETVNTRTISLFTTDKVFISISKEGMEEALKGLNIGVKALARRSNAMWDILLVWEEEAKSLQQRQ